MYSTLDIKHMMSDYAFEQAEEKEAMRIEELERESFLTYVGKNDEGEHEFIGTKEQWSYADKKWGLQFEDWDEDKITA